MFKRLTMATLMLGVLMTGVSGVTNAGSVHAAAAPTRAARLHKHVSKKPAHAGRPAWRVTAVSGDTISAVTRSNQPVTITVAMTTTYREPGTTATLASVHPGELIVVRGKTTAPRTIRATAVRILFARVAGVVTAVNGSALTVTGAAGAPRTVTIGAATAITRAGAAATPSAIAPGTAIVAAGTPNADGSLNAVRITIRVAHMAGAVRAVSGSTLTIQGPYGATYSVVTSGSTTYFTRQGRLITPATLAAVTAGRRIVAYGARSGDGKTLTAARIVIGRTGQRAV